MLEVRKLRAAQSDFKRVHIPQVDFNDSDMMIEPARPILSEDFHPSFGDLIDKMIDDGKLKRHSY